MNCLNCGTPLPENVFKCPSCRHTVENYKLTFDKKGGLDKTISKSIAHLTNQSLLSKLDDLNSLDESGMNHLLDLNDLSNSISDLKTTNIDKLRDLESLVLKNEGEVVLYGIEISDLLKDNKNKLQLIKTGLVFLKHRKYKEAIDWWTINRKNLDTSEKSTYMLLLIFEAYTYYLLDDKEELQKIQDKIKIHPLYAKYRQ